ncbi:hypothetical protein SNE40_015960 [Patella caerulea]|uniref:Uncharacterized protein n=1 Tax=Patella caerulea TaxID=87958 RepID=A0AAN8J7W6_PATCE
MEGQATEVDTASVNGQRLFNVQNIYGTPQIPRKRPCIQVRPRRMTLIDLRNVSLSEEDVPHRKASSGTVRSEGGLPASQYYTKHGILPIYDSTDSLDSKRSSTGMKIRRIPSLLDGTTRFPKLEECAHFHYDVVELGPIEVHLCDDDRENYHHNEEEGIEDTFLMRVKSNEKAWNIRRTFGNFRSLDKQLHRCIFDRKFSQLVELQRQDEEKENTDLRRILRRYLERFSYLAGSMINCGSVLNWLELDNRGNRLLAVDDSGINTPAIAAAHAIKRYNAQAVDEISLEVGDIVSVIDMPPAEDTIWWRGKRGFEVGFFPSECVELIGDKVPSSMDSKIPEYILIRRHGKLMSFLRTFFSTRPARNQLKQSGIVKERVFGCDLGEHLLNSGHDVPLVLKSCTEVIERDGIVDGIYRLSGITSNIQKLRLAFDEDCVPDLRDDCYLQDIHSISSLLKMYLRELPNPLLTYQLYDKFADAVRDEDNKLLRIHDVVQQLPPPHYRTTEYLMKHLARVAEHSHETGMHSKNLAIVWAPNLLRSKELEMGGGAAALQGVGIQAVVTECLICYSDIIFSDKMPSYSSPELQKAHKKPRPKSLAISTPTRLLTLEEARERAFVGGLIPMNQKFIDVGGGPDSLPAKYHTVIDLPGYKKKSVSTKTKKSPVSGWKSIFSKPRSGSIKKARKSSIQDNLNITPVQGKALTEEDVHNWKKRLRSAKSAESLLSLASSNRSSGGRIAKAPDNTMVLNVYKEERPHHKRSLSSDATAILSQHSHIPIFLESGREMPIDVDSSVVPHVMEDIEMSPSRTSRPMRREDPGKGSFIRGDSSRLPLHHRRTPSAPNTPNQERSTTKTQQVSAHQKTLSQPALESPSQVQRRQVYTYIHSSEESLNGEHFIDGNTGKPKNNLSPISSQAKYAKSAEELTPQKRSAKTPPKGRKKTKNNSPDKSPKSPPLKEVVQLPESPGARRKVQTGDSPTKPSDKNQYFFSRTHDYAEIMSDEENGRNRDSSFRDSDILCSPCDMRDFIEHIDNKFAKHKQSSSYVDNSPEKKESLSNGSQSSWQNNEQFNRRLNDSYDYAQVQKRTPQQNGSQISPTVAGLDYTHTDSQRSQDIKNYNSSASANREAVELGSHIHKSSSKNKMSKCLSVPSDIAKSLENITAGSNMDLLSSVTISELSQSVDSFNHSFNHEEGRYVRDPRRRRSASCDSLNAADSQLCRTLREINQQMDKTFQQNVDRALQLEGEGYHRHEHDRNNVHSLHLSESYPSAVGQKRSFHNSYECIPDSNSKSLLEDHHEKLSRENPTFLSSIPLDLFENNTTEISSNMNKSPSYTQDTHTDSIAGIYRRRNSSSSDSSTEMARVDVTRQLGDKPSLHHQYEISGHAMFPAEDEDQTAPFPVDLTSSQLYAQQLRDRELAWRNSGSSDGPDYARINKNKTSPTLASTNSSGQNLQSIHQQDRHSNIIINTSYDGQNNNEPLYCQINRANPQRITTSPISFDASPKPSPRNPQSLPQQQTSSNLFVNSSLPQTTSPIPDGWQTPRTFRRSDDNTAFAQQNITSLSQSLNMSAHQAMNNQLHTSTSLPEVHVHQDTLTVQKPTIKKSTTASELEMDSIIQKELESCFKTEPSFNTEPAVQSTYVPVPKPRKTVSELRADEETSDSDRMTIEDIKQAHKAVREGEKMLEMLDSSNAGKKLEDVVMEHIDVPKNTNVLREPSPNLFLRSSPLPREPSPNLYLRASPVPREPSPNFFLRASPLPDEAKPVRASPVPNTLADDGNDKMTNEDIRKAHKTVKQGEKMLKVLDSSNAGKKLEDVVFEQLDPAPKSRSSFTERRTELEAWPAAEQQPQRHSWQFSERQPEFDNSRRFSPQSIENQHQPMTEQPAESDHNRMTIEDIKQAHKTVKEGEKVLRMLDSSNAGQKMEDLVREQQMEAAPKHTSQIPVIDYNSRDVTMVSPRPDQYPMTNLGMEITMNASRNRVPSPFLPNEVPLTVITNEPPLPVVQNDIPVLTTVPAASKMDEKGDDDRMTIADIKRAHRTVKDGEKMLHMLDSSNAGRKLEDVVFEHIEVDLPSSRNSADYTVIQKPSTMSSSYSDSSGSHHGRPSMSNSWSGSSSENSDTKKNFGTKKNSDNVVFIPASHLPATVIESRCEKTAPDPTGEVTESQLLRVESFGEIDSEEFQNVINRGKALIQADKAHIDTKILPTSAVIQKNTSLESRILPGQPIAVCRASDVSNVNVPHGDILRAPSFISSAVAPVPSPKARTSVKVGTNDIPPPHQEVIEVTRPSVIKGKKGSKESKNVKSVHSCKMSYPPRHLAEFMDDTSDSLTTDFSSTGPSDADPSGLSSTDDDVFSDVNENSQAFRRSKLIENRDFDFRASLGKMERVSSIEKVSSDPVKISVKAVDEMISSRSSLDESLLTIVAERHDIFGPEAEEEPGFNTGSLRVKRSQKLKSLVELFESVSDNNDSDSSSPSTRPKDRRHMTSSQPSMLTHSVESSSKYEADTDDELTPTRVRTNSFRHRSRSRSRDRARKSSGIGSDKENRLQSRSPTPSRKPPGGERTRDLDFPPPQGSPSDSSSDRSRKQKSRSEKYSSMGKPPKYRSNSRTRTHSESSTSESESSLHHDHALLHRLTDCDVILRDQNRTDLRFRETAIRKSIEDSLPERCDLQRRGSIKELREFFECRKSDPDQEESTSSAVKTSQDRIKSVSPSFRETSGRSEISSTSAMRFSLELPSGSTLSHAEGVLKPQAVRLGPKPFYGSKK